MRTIIAGSRSVRHHDELLKAIRDSGFKITTVISGCANGVDKLGEDWAGSNAIPVEKFPANWTLHGKKAGYLRNVQMAENADALIAVWHGGSKGTMHMIEIAKQKGLRVHVHIIP